MALSVRDVQRVRRSQEALRSGLEQLATENDANFNARGPGPKTWVGVVLGVMWFDLFGVVGVVLAVLSWRKGKRARRLWESGDRVQADALVSSAAKLQRAALVIGFLAPLCLVAIGIVVLVFSGEPAAARFVEFE